MCGGQSKRIRFGGRGHRTPKRFRIAEVKACPTKSLEYQLMTGVVSRQILWQSFIDYA